MISYRFLAAAVLAAMIPAAAFAQASRPPGAPAPMPSARGAHHGHHHGGLRAALRRLDLSSAQQQQIDEAFARTKAANRNADRAARKTNMQALRADVDRILTPDQRTQLQAAMRRSRRENPRAGFAPPAPSPAPDR